MKNFMKYMLALGVLLTLFLCDSCSNGNDDSNTNSLTEYTVTLYTEFGGSSISTKIERNMSPTKNGYDFKGWFSADGTDYTNKAITNDVTLFAYFVKSTTTKDGNTTITKTNEIGADSYESEKTVSETENLDGTKVTVTIESTARTNADGSKTETESKITERFDGTDTTVTSETTVSTKDSNGKTTSKVETVTSADGTKTVTTTDAEGNTTTEITGGTEPSPEKLPVTLSSAGLPTFEIAIPKGTTYITIYRKKYGADAFSKIMQFWALDENKLPSVFEETIHVFTDWYVEKDGAYSYYYKLQDDEGNISKSSESDFVTVTNGKMRELTVSLADGAASYDAETGCFTLDKIPLFSISPAALNEYALDIGVSFDEQDYGIVIHRERYNYYENGSEINFYKIFGEIADIAGKTATPYWEAYLHSTADGIAEEWYPAIRKFYGNEYGLPESIIFPSSAQSDSYTVTVNEIGDTLARLSAKGTAQANIIVTDATADTLAAIKTALDANSTVTVSLDLSESTELSAIVKSVFKNTTNLAEINFPSLVTTIEADAFYGCANLADVTLPVGLGTLGGGAFGNCTSLESITIPSSVTEILGGAFMECAGLKEIIVEAGNTSYKAIDGVLYSFDLTVLHTYPLANTADSFRIPDSVTSISSDAFNGCISLKTITIPAGVKNIGDYAFYSCENLETIQLPVGLETIGYWAFAYCPKIASLELPESLTSIGGSAFKNCTALAGAVTIPGGIKTIATGMFEHCIKLEKIIISDGITKINNNAFNECTLLTDVTLPNSLIEIGGSVFMNCEKLETLAIPENVASFGTMVFQGCSKFTRAVFADTTSIWYTKDGTEIGAMSATDTSANATKLKKSYAYGTYDINIYNSKYTE